MVLSALHHGSSATLLGMVQQSPVQLTSDDVLEPTDGDNVTGESLLDVLAVVGVHEHQTADALLLALVGVERVRAGLQLARVDAAEGQRPDKGVGRDLEAEAGERRVVGGGTGHRDLGVLYRHTLDLTPVQGRGQVPAQEE